MNPIIALQVTGTLEEMLMFLAEKNETALHVK